MSDIVECKECRRLRLRYQDCDGKEWYSYGDIFFCSHQIIWVLENAEFLGGGQWPYSPVEEKEIEESEEAQIAGLGRVATINPSAAYSTAGSDKIKDILYEVEWRLGQLGKLMRKLLLLHLKTGEPMSQEVKLAFHYITGVRRKREPFHKWKFDRKRGQNRHFIGKNPPI